MPTDEELLRRFADEHDEPAFTELVRRRIDFVYAVALGQVGGDAHLAQDAAQEVFLDLARKAASVAAGPALVSWLYTATRFAAAKVGRRQTRWLIREQEALTMNTILSDGTDPEWETLRPVLDDAMHELGEQDRTALLLRYFENRPLAEIGTKLGLAENSARMRVDRALTKLQTRLAKRGIVSTAAALGSTLAAQLAITAPAGLGVSVAGASLTVGTGSATLAALLAISGAHKIAVGSTVALAVTLLLTATFQQRANTELRQRIAAQMQQNERLLRAKLAAAPPAEAIGLSKELKRLQSEAAALQAKIPAAPPSQMKPQASWRNVGRDTPSNAFETILWAVFNDQWSVQAEAAASAPSARAEIDAYFASLPAAIREKYGTPEQLSVRLTSAFSPIAMWRLIEQNSRWKGRVSYKVVSEKQIRSDPDVVELRLLVPFEPAKPEGNFRAELVKTSDGWKMYGCSLPEIEKAVAKLDPATGDLLPGKK